MSQKKSGEIADADKFKRLENELLELKKSYIIVKRDLDNYPTRPGIIRSTLTKLSQFSK